MWKPTADEIAYYKRNARLESASDEYITDQLPLLLEHINEECSNVEFKYENLPANVKMFLFGALNFLHSAQYGVKSEKMGSVSFTYDYDNIPANLTGLLSKYGYKRSQNGARYHVL